MALEQQQHTTATTFAHAGAGTPAEEIDFIAGLVESGTTVLDLGCGTGELLKALQERKKVFPQGVEISEECIQACVSRGLPVYHGDLDEGLEDFADQALDFVILTNVIQVLHRPDYLLREAARVGKKVIVSFPNFAHFRSRVQLGLRGQMPRTSSLPYQWYDSPNIHLTTITDFVRLLKAENLVIVDRLYLAGSGSSGLKRVKFLPNLLAEHAIFVIQRPHKT